MGGDNSQKSWRSWDASVLSGAGLHLLLHHDNKKKRTLGDLRALYKHLKDSLTVRKRKKEMVVVSYST